MFINDALIFLQLHKTGCTHIADLIQARWPGEESDKHEPLRDDPGGRAILGSVRNPLDWYVSLWAYGCQMKGDLRWFLTAPMDRIIRTHTKKALLGREAPGEALRRTLSHRGKDAAFWTRVYSDSANAGHFREWLAAIHAPGGRELLIEGYPDHPMKAEIGFYSYRFLHLFSRNDLWRAESRSLQSYDQVRGFFDRACLVEHFIRTEAINDDLGRALSAIYGSEVRFEQRQKTNASRHRDPASYYDAESAALVRRRERLIYALFYPDEPPRAAAPPPADDAAAMPAGQAAG